MAKTYRPVPIPAGVELRVESDTVTAKGRLGILSIPKPDGVLVKTEDNKLVVEGDANTSRRVVGTTRALIINMLVGVTQGYERVVELRGMGYRIQKTKEGLQATCGFSHPVDIVAPPGITLDVNQVPNPEDTKEQMFEIIIKGIDKHAVGAMAARIRAIKPPDSYHGKGFRYRGERVRKKAGKRAVGAQQ
ncbi:MAG: 50S ribosomal protein L6 [candidate division WOR-3 bacterium]